MKCVHNEVAPGMWFCPVCSHKAITSHRPSRECGTSKPSPQAVGKQSVRVAQSEECRHLGGLIREQVCKPCQASGVSPVSVFSCALHGECTKRSTSVHPRIKACSACEDFDAVSPYDITPTMPVDVVMGLIVSSGGPRHPDWAKWDNVRAAHRELARRSWDSVPEFPDNCQGRGVVVTGGGKYFISAYVTIRVLREVGCTLPIELWHFDGEIDLRMRGLLRPLNVVCRSADDVTPERPFRWLETWKRGWQLKPFALAHCSFEEVLMLDADSYPVRNPEFLFDWKGYTTTGAVFWPDLHKSQGLLTEDACLAFSVPMFLDGTTESGQMVVNKRRCWREVNLTLHHNSHADFTYDLLYGDKDTFPIAWKQCETQYARMWPRAEFGSNCVWQMDDHGTVLFLHRVHDKLRLPGTVFDATPQHTQENEHHPEIPMDDFAFGVLTELREMRTGYLVPSLTVRNDFDLAVVKSVIDLDEYRIRSLWEAGLQVKVALDVGAHVGSFTRLVKHYWPEAMVIAVDADATAAAYYKANTTGLGGVHHYHGAVTAVGGPSRVRLIKARDGNDGGNYVAEVVEGLLDVPGDSTFEWVDATDILTLLERYNSPSIDLMKLDAEGAEAAILSDLQSDGYLTRVKHIVGEWHYVPSIERIRKALAATHDLTLYQHAWQWGLFLAHPRS